MHTQEKKERNPTCINRARVRRELLDMAATRFTAYQNITGRVKFTRVSAETLDMLEGQIKQSLQNIVSKAAGGRTL